MAGPLELELAQVRFVKLQLSFRPLPIWMFLQCLCEGILAERSIQKQFVLMVSSEVLVCILSDPSSRDIQFRSVLGVVVRPMSSWRCKAVHSADAHDPKDVHRGPRCADVAALQEHALKVSHESEVQRGAVLQPQAMRIRPSCKMFCELAVARHRGFRN